MKANHSLPQPSRCASPSPLPRRDAAPATPAAATVEPPKCDPKPEYPGRLALQSDNRVKAFRKELDKYKDCINAYLADRKAAMQGERGRVQRHHRRLQRGDEEDQRRADRLEGRLTKAGFSPSLLHDRLVLPEEDLSFLFGADRLRIRVHRPWRARRRAPSRAARGSRRASASGSGTRRCPVPGVRGLIHG